VRQTDIERSHVIDVCRCSVCDLLFFIPVESSESLLARYAALSGELWTGPGYSRPDWDLARGTILRLVPSGSVLDVGCWTGEFLSSLPDSFAKYGVEPSVWAHAEAAKHGVSLLGGSLADLAERTATFNVITFIDVLEHSTSPLQEISAASRLLSRGGVVVVATGNSRSLPWRLMPRDYWYYFTEHKCFFSRQWFEWVCVEANLHLVEVRPFSHFPGTTWGAGVDLARAFAFRAFAGPRSLVYRALSRTRAFALGPGAVRWRDHILVVLGSPRSA
jgi:SAM-dependent methyltransferase